jgi:serine/threonine protein phosphatase PrpC
MDASVPTFTWRSAATTSRGNVRTHNEDAVLELPAAGLWVVADGMGGHNAGAVASRMIVEALGDVTRRERASDLLDAVEDRLFQVNQHLQELSRGGGVSGSTVVALIAVGQHCLSLWAGDSRVYRARGDELACITRDHSEVQALIDEGIDPARVDWRTQNVITRAVGGASRLLLDVELRRLQHDDRYLLCSDGLYRELSEQQLLQQLREEEPSRACSGLMKQALAGTCNDNVSAIVVHFKACASLAPA